MPEAEIPILSDRMRKFAAANPEKAGNLVELADAFDKAHAGFNAEAQTVSVASFMGAWARARRAFCDASGEALI
jgi:hypothetical protein